MLGNFIIDGIKSIFIPSDDYFSEKIEYIQSRFRNSFGITEYDMSFMFRTETAFKNVTIKLLGQEMTIIDMSYFIGAIGTFRPILRAFITFLLIFYNINQFFGLIGQQSIMTGVHILSGLGKNKGDEEKLY